MLPGLRPARHCHAHWLDPTAKSGTVGPAYEQSGVPAIGISYTKPMMSENVATAAFPSKAARLDCVMAGAARLELGCPS